MPGLTGLPLHAWPRPGVLVRNFFPSARGLLSGNKHILSIRHAVCRYGYDTAEYYTYVIDNYAAAGIPLETFVADSQYMDAQQGFTLGKNFPQATMAVSPCCGPQAENCWSTLAPPPPPPPSLSPPLPPPCLRALVRACACACLCNVGQLLYILSYWLLVAWIRQGK